MGQGLPQCNFSNLIDLYNFYIFIVWSFIAEWYEYVENKCYL